MTWDGLAQDLGKLSDRSALSALMEKTYPDRKPKAVHNWGSQVRPFAQETKTGDLVVLPLKTQPAIYIGEISGEYHFEANGPDPYYHWRPVK